MSSTTAAFSRSFNRFSSSHDVQHVSSTEPGVNQKRTSKLNEIIARTRTASLPPRPHTSSGPPMSSSRQKLSARLGNLKGKGKDRGDLGIVGEQAVSSIAASSLTSVVDPFAAHPTTSSSFVTYLPSKTPPAPLVMRPQTADANAASSSSVYSPPNSPTAPNQSSQSIASPPRRRGSLLVAASDALSSIARKTPMRSLHLNMSGLGRQSGGKGAGIINTTQPIVLTEVIEISESAIRASKLREEEEQERERLRDAAARALGIGEVDIDSSSLNSRRRGRLDDLDDNEHGQFEVSEDEYGGWDDAVTPTATSLPSLPIPLATHSRSRSGSFIPPINILSQSTRPSTPLSSSFSSHLGLPAPQLNMGPVRTYSAKSLSTPPALTMPSIPSGNRSTSRVRADRDAATTVVPPEIPHFPSTPAMLSQFTQRAGTIPRYYPAPSLLMFTLSKQWKSRYIVFTSPISSRNSPTFSSPWAHAGAGTTPPPSYLHLFKGPGTDEKEIERLEVNEESVVYVAEGEVGGRRGVIKVGGFLRKKPSGASPRPSSSSASAGLGSRTSSSSMGSMDDASEDGRQGISSTISDSSSVPTTSGENRTMWVLQILDPEEAKEWIGAIKGSVLSQRSIRAGLGVPPAMNGAEPRGDLDVMLSMRASSLISSSVSPLQKIDVANANTVRVSGGASPTQSSFTSQESSPISLLSRSHSTTAANSLSSATSAGPDSTLTSPQTNGSSSPTPRPNITAGTALKSLFTIGGGRPRSPSTVSAQPPSPSDDDHDVRVEDSFSYAGASLMGMIRSDSYISDRPMSPPVSVPATPRVGTPIVPTETHPFLLERKILPDSDRQMVENELTGEQPIMIKRANVNMGLGTPRHLEGRPTAPGRVSSDGVSSPSLQPPPRKRAGTVNAVTVSVSAPEESASYSYAHANSSTAESLGINVAVKSPNLLTPSPPLPTTPLPSRFKDRRGRTSWSSVSTYGSNDQSPSSPDEAKPGRRWSRRGSLSQRMSPPYPSPSSPPSSPKSPAMRTSSLQHPYAAEETSLSRSSSVGSGQSRVSELHVRSFSTRRASGASMQSFSTASTTQAHSAAMSNKSMVPSPKPRSSHRASAPPPQRPAPMFALPPTPTDEGTSPTADSIEPTPSLPIPKSSFRESLTLRGKRLSSTPPTLPPSSVLPPRPDEPGYHAPVNAHRRSSSQGTNIPTSSLNPVSSSPTHGKAPFPPPNTPLPLPPSSGSPAPSSPTRPVSTIKRRFRILSSPPTSPPQSAPPMPPLDIPPTFSFSFDHNAIPESPIHPLPIRPLPIGEPITTMQNDPSFLFMSPTTPARVSPTDDMDPQGLSPPPPRRSSRQVSTSDTEKLQKDLEPSVEVVLDAASDGSTPIGPAPAPPPEVDDFASLLTPTAIRSSDHSAVSLVDVRM